MRNIPRPSARIAFLFCVLLLSAGVFVDFSGQWAFPDTRVLLEKGEKIKLEKSGAEQVFVASRDGLAGVNILFGGSSVKEGGTLRLRLLDAQCAKTICEENRFVTTLNADNSTDFFFKRLPDSEGKTYCLRIAFDPEKGSKKGNVFIMPNPLPEEFGALTINNEAKPEMSLAFRPSYRNGSIVSDFGELIDRISQYKPRFLKSGFLAFLFLSSIGLSFFFLFLITPSRRR